MQGDSRLSALRERLRSCRTMLSERHGATPANSSEEDMASSPSRAPAPHNHGSDDQITTTTSSSRQRSRSTFPDSDMSSLLQDSFTTSTRSSSSSVEVARVHQRLPMGGAGFSPLSVPPSRSGSAIAGRAGTRRGVQTGKQVWDACCNGAVDRLQSQTERLEVGEEAAGAICDAATRWHQREQHRARLGMLSKDDEGSSFVALLRNAPADSPDRLLLDVVEEIEEAINKLSLPPPPAGTGLIEASGGRHVRSTPIYPRLMDFQKEGVSWLYELWQEGWNTILADEMGLGKTVQTIALLQARRLAPKSTLRGRTGPTLIVAPLSTLTNWKSEFAVFDPTQRIASLVGDVAARNAVAKRVLKGEVDVLLMQFDSLARKMPRGSAVSKLRGVQWGMLVVDEAHRIKNSESTLYTALDGMHFHSKVILTGTPLQNSVRELLSLIKFMIPLLSTKQSKRRSTTQFGSLAELVDAILRQTAAATGGSSSAAGGGGEEAQLFQNEQLRIYVCRRLHRLIEPFLLRRERDDVLTNMPAKDEYVITCPTSAHQRGLLTVLEERRKAGMFTGCTAIDFRKVLLHPYLVDRTSYYISEEVIYSSGKFYALDLMTRFLWATGNHKFLIFCSWTKVLDLVESMNIERDMPYVRLCGSVSGDNRADRIQQFNTAPSKELPCFLISKIAGGVGLNLQAADTVIMLDEDYNPQRDLQALSRVYRVGQSKHVKVFRLAIQHAQEERITAIAKDKEQLAQAVMSAGMYNLKATDQDREEAVTSIISKTPVPSSAPSSPTAPLPTTSAAEIESCSQFNGSDVTLLGQELLRCVPRGDAEVQQFKEFLQVEAKRKRTDDGAK